jgi:hypothetical protein
MEPGRVINYLTVDPIGSLEWTTDNLKALRLSRREDGDALSYVVEDADAVEEHGWFSPASPASGGTVDG